jgi:hypothetical protein
LMERLTGYGCMNWGTDRQMTNRQSNGEKDGETDRLMDG